MPWTGRGVYVPVRAGVGAAGAAGLAAFAAGFAAAFLGAAVFFATGFCLGAAFFTGVVPDFFFFFMGRTVPQRERAVK
jgi:hypothetical protein